MRDFHRIIVVCTCGGFLQLGKNGSEQAREIDFEMFAEFVYMFTWQAADIMCPVPALAQSLNPVSSVEVYRAPLHCSGCLAERGDPDSCDLLRVWQAAEAPASSLDTAILLWLPFVIILFRLWAGNPRIASGQSLEINRVRRLRVRTAERSSFSSQRHICVPFA